MAILSSYVNKMVYYFKVFLHFFRKRTDAENFSISKFMEFTASEIKPSERILDAGAGKSPYKDLFSHARYESTDFADIFNKPFKDSQDFICDLCNIPKPDNSYDAIICTQVLEHIEEPQRAINEFFRILKPNGKLFLTAPQGWGLHGEPYHFFNFTKYGLQSLFQKARFEIIFIKPRGGIFWYLGKRLKTFPSYIMNQYKYEKGCKKPDEYHRRFLAALLYPFYFAGIPFCCFFVPLLFFYLDKLDKKQSYTLGYACYCAKI